MTTFKSWTYVIIGTGRGWSESADPCTRETVLGRICRSWGVLPDQVTGLSPTLRHGRPVSSDNQCKDCGS